MRPSDGGGPSARPPASPRSVAAATPPSWSSRRPTSEPRSTAMLATLISASETVTSTKTATMSRTRNGVRASSRRHARQGRATSTPTGSHRPTGILLAIRQAQDVADPADGVDQPRLDRVDLATQVRHVRLDDAGVAPEVVVPDVVEDLALGQHPPGAGHQVAQQLELGRRQLHPPARPPDLVALLVQLQVGGAQPGRGRGRAGGAGAAQYRPD